MKVEEKYAVASVKAFIERDGKILILRESPKYKGGGNHGRYVMPGGKISVGEYFLDALKREIKEECGMMAVSTRELFHIDEWHLNIAGVRQSTVATYFRVLWRSGKVKLSEEFDSYEWIEPRNYKKFDLNPAAPRAFRAYLKLITSS